MEKITVFRKRTEAAEKSVKNLPQNAGEKMRFLPDFQVNTYEFLKTILCRYTKKKKK